MNKWVTGEWVVEQTSAKQRRVLHYWLTIVWFTVGLSVWIVLRDELWFVGFMTLYAIWVTHLAGWAAETPVEHEATGTQGLEAPVAGISPDETTHVSSEVTSAVSGK